MACGIILGLEAGEARDLNGGRLNAVTRGLRLCWGAEI